MRAPTEQRFAPITRSTEILTENGRVTGVAGNDVLTGEPFRYAAPVVVNVAGPWVDEVLARSNLRQRSRLIGGSKGSHIVVEPFPGAPRDALYAEARQDGRPFFIIPWNDLYLIGTTDTRYDGDLDEVVAEEWEIDLLLAETNRVIPAAKLTRESVRYTYAGVRPLPYTPDESEGEITRRHIMHDHELEATGGARGLISIVGGKLTTYRELAEQCVDLVVGKLGRAAVRSRTAEMPLPGARTDLRLERFCRDLRQGIRSFAPTGEHLLRVYGARAPKVLAAASTPELREIFDPFTGAIAAEVPWAFHEEGARTLADVIARRTMVGLGPDAGIGADVAAAKIARDAFGWDTAQTRRRSRRLPAVGTPLPASRPGARHDRGMTALGTDPGEARQFAERFPRLDESDPDHGRLGRRARGQEASVRVVRHVFGCAGVACERWSMRNQPATDECGGSHAPAATSWRSGPGPVNRSRPCCGIVTTTIEDAGTG